MRNYSDIEAKALEGIVGNIAQLKVMPQVVYQVLQNTESDFGSAASIEKAIAVDPGFSAKVLTQANSAYYGLPKKVTTVRDSVMLLGFKNLREIAMNASVMDMFIGKTDEESLRRRNWWKHSVDAATICRWLAEKEGNVSPHLAYTCGLLHYIGKTILDQHKAGAYHTIVERANNGESCREVERDIFKVDHIDVGCAIVKHWGFEESIVETLDYETAPEAGHEVPITRAIVAVAFCIAKHHANPNRGYFDDLKGREWAWSRLGYSFNDLEPIVNQGCTVLAPRGQAA